MNTGLTGVVNKQWSPATIKKRGDAEKPKE